MNNQTKIILGILLLVGVIISLLFSWNFYQKSPGEIWNRTDFVDNAVCGDNGEKCVTEISCREEECPDNMICIIIGKAVPGGTVPFNCVYKNFMERYNYNCIFLESNPPQIENCYIKK